MNPEYSLDNQILNNNLILNWPVISEACVQHRYTSVTIGGGRDQESGVTVGVQGVAVTVVAAPVAAVPAATRAGGVKGAARSGKKPDLMMIGRLQRLGMENTAVGSSLFSPSQQMENRRDFRKLTKLSVLIERRSLHTQQEFTGLKG